MEICIKIQCILAFGLFFSCQESNNTFHQDSFAVKDTFLIDVPDSKLLYNETNEIGKSVDSLEIVESLGYEHGYDKGFDDAGSEMYEDKPEEIYIIGKYHNVYVDAFKRGYEDGWIEWKNRNGDYDY